MVFLWKSMLLVTVILFGVQTVCTPFTRSFSLFNINCLFLMQRYLEEVDMERYMKVLEQNQQVNQ